MSPHPRDIARFSIQTLLFIAMILLAMYQFKIRTVPQPVHFDNAEKALKEGREADARKEFDNAIHFRPDDLIVYVGIIGACEKQNKPQLEVEYAERGVAACKQKPADVRSAMYQLLSGVYSKIEKSPHQQHAIAAAKQALDLQPERHVFQNQYGYLLADNAQNKGADVDAALAVLKIALNGIKSGSSAADDAQLGPDFTPEVEDSYGWALYKNEQYPDAVTELTQALGDYPPSEPGEAVKVSYYHLGMAFSKMGRPVDARNAFNSALAYDPKYDDALAGLKSLNSTTPKPAPTSK